MHSQASKDGHMNQNTAETMAVSAALEELRSHERFTPHGLGKDTENSSDNFQLGWTERRE